ncbi:MAG: protein translocase subunit SecF, partial [Planctomycetota bacterium]
TGDGQITGRFSREEAQALATVLNTGALPQSLKIISEETVGPTLGESSIKQGINSLIISGCIVVLFMIVIYNVSGILACFALLLNLFLLISIVNIFGATLTLPGLAGIVLTLAMALDANILIFERLKEEHLAGKTLLVALESAHERALTAITDANLTTLLAGIILIIFGAGSIKGFGITLSIGILTTLFTAVYVTKFFLRLVIEWQVIKTIKYLSLIKMTNINFLKPSLPCFIMSIAVITTTLAFAIYRGKNVFNIDFTGGSVIGITTKQPHTPDILQKKILELKTVDNNIERVKYQDIEIQGVGEKELTRDLKWGYMKFQLRTKFQNTEEFQNDIMNALKDIIADKPIEKPVIIDKGTRQGYAEITFNFAYSISVEEFEKEVKNKFKDNNWGDVIIDKGRAVIDKGNLKRIKIYVEPSHTSELARITNELYKEFKFDKYEPIVYSSNVGSVVASELKEKALWALLFSWVAIVIYLWFRFDFIYGLAAVLALIHDVLVSFGVTAFVGMLFPHSLGITLQMGMNAIAALLTVVGYSVNDTIVIFDFVRHNKKIQKKMKFYDIINMSLNQTLSRTILTSVTVFLAAIILFLFSYTSNSSIAVLSFILIVGTITGVYSTIYIASYIAYLFRGKENEAAG